MATHDKDVDFQKVSINHATLLEIAYSAFYQLGGDNFFLFSHHFLLVFFFISRDFFSSCFLVSWWSSTSCWFGIIAFIITSTAWI